MDQGKIILLNGTSSSGKTSIAHALQELFEIPFLHVSIDDFLLMLPTRFVDFISGAVQPSEDELEKLQGYFPRVLTGTHASVAALASEGNSLIVDYVFEQQSDLRMCVNRLADFSVHFVGVHCSLEELQRREKQRDRRQGLAEEQFGNVHAHGVYDVEVNTTSTSTKECAFVIKRAFEQTQPTAFKELRTSTA